MFDFQPSSAADEMSDDDETGIEQELEEQEEERLGDAPEVMTV